MQFADLENEVAKSKFCLKILSKIHWKIYSKIRSKIRPMNVPNGSLLKRLN